jgi:hypothetical protein
VPLVLLELDLTVGVVDATRDARQAGNELRRLEADSHLVAIILAADRRAVDTRPDLDAED